METVLFDLTGKVTLVTGQYSCSWYGHGKVKVTDRSQNRG